MFPVFLGLILAGLVSTLRAVSVIETDLCVYGGTSGGVVAAVQAARLGKSVALVTVNEHFGGMTSSGLGVTDVGQVGAIGGMAREFYRRVGQRYNSANPVYWFEPKVAESVFRQMLAEAGVPIFTNQLLASVTKSGQRLAEITMEGGAVFRAKMFIDTTYEGDLMAMAGTSFTVGREGVSTYGETLAGVRAPGGSYSYDPYIVPGNAGSGLLPLLQSNTLGALGSSDHHVQAYNFRLCLTQNATNKISLTSTAPPNYSAARYELAARYVEARVAADGSVSLGQLIHIQQLIPNGKTDINANGELSSDFVGASWTWATNTHAGRASVRQAHEEYLRGLLYFFGTSPRVPATVRAEMQTWGLAKDEFTDAAGWPHQIYVREARRLVGAYVMRQQNCQGLEFAPDSIGLASYAMDSHSLTRVASDGFARSEGGLFATVPQPFPISYRSIIPRTGECENIFSTFALSASHVAFASCRMEPVFMITSQSAATAAAFAIDEVVPVQQVNYARLAAQLRADGQLLDWVGGTLTTNGVILDNGNPGVAQVGSWSTGANPGFWGTSYLTDQNAGKGGKYVRFTPNLPFSGLYDVFGWWVENANRASNVPYDIVHATGTNRVLVNQQVNGSRWIFLLRTNFVAGQGGGVILRNDGTTGFVIADAVRFLPVGAFVVPPPTVLVIASDAVASEFGTDHARFTFVRDGDLSLPLLVNYALGGSAVRGLDFAAPLGPLTIPAGSNAVALFIAPLVDEFLEGDETVVVTLQPSVTATYQLSALTNATALIRDGNTLTPRLNFIEREGTDSVVVQFEAEAERSYVLQASDFICPPAWKSVVAVPAEALRRTVRLTNAVSPESNSRFYRLVAP